jgi:transposase
MSVDELFELFCEVDDFWQVFLPVLESGLLSSGAIQRRRERSLCISEVMTILIAFHQSGYRTFKAYYLEQVLAHWRTEFPGLVSYSRFIEFVPLTAIPLMAYLHCLFGECTGISYIDSTVLAVCRNQRIHQHKVFKGLAARGKSSMGWFFGFKLHLVFNDRGELLNLALTPGNTDDRKPVPDLVKDLFGKLLGDKGYLSQALFDQLLRDFDIQLITKLKTNMKNRLMHWADKLLLRKRAITECIIDQLKNISQIEHSRHRSVTNFVVNLLCGLIAYCHQPKKPSLHLDAHLAITA